MSKKPQSKPLAIIDVGTLKAKFEIRQFEADGRHKVLHKDKQLTVLGRDLTKTDGFIIDGAVEKTIAALQEFKVKMQDYEVVRYRAVTTEAIRQARNAEAVLKRISDETGIALETLSHEDEAVIFFRHMAQHFPGKRIAIADIGGGSVQLVVGRDADVEAVHLFKTGTYFMQEMFSESHHPSAEEQSKARDYVREQFAQFARSGLRAEELVYGSSNIIDFMKAMALPFKSSGYDALHPHRIAVRDLRRLYDKLDALSYEDRMPLYPAEPYYMWAADKALMNVFELAEILGVDSVIPTNENISSGLFAQLRTVA